MSLAERYSKLEPRERRLLLGFGGTVVAGIFLFLPIYLYQTVGAARDQNQEIRDFLEKVNESRDKIAKRKAERETLLARYTKKMPPLATFVEDAAKANQIEISESSAKPDVPHGKKYNEHVLSVRMKKVGLLGFSKTLEKIERSGYPVAITKLKLTPRAGEPDSYDVEMHVSAFERKGDAKDKKADAAEDEGKEEEL
jgi:general secretion pathway protein M